MNNDPLRLTGAPSRGLLAADPVSDFDAGPPRISFEFFPPKTPEMDERLWAVIHQVLHYAERPGDAIAEAARVLRPNGVLIVADFAPHTLEFLREEQAHRRLGFTDGEVAEWCRTAGLDPAPPRHLPGDPLTVVIWTAFRREPMARPHRGVRAAGQPAASAEKALLG